jgi:DNA processing protein
LAATCGFAGFGPVRIRLLLSYFDSAREMWSSGQKKLAQLGLPPKLISGFDEYRRDFDISGYFAKLKDLGICVFSISDKDYPDNLRELPDAPPVLYIRGTLKKTDRNAVAIVGTRMMTSYGREVAGELACKLTGYGVTIVSGLALGVDAQAQKSALGSGGRTIAVLASGLDIISPQSNRFLAMEILKGNGAIVSEYPLGHVPFKSDFAIRNRLISGLSKAVVVVEARMKSGTFYTVNAALSQGRPVYAVPGPITSYCSEAPNYLIQNGAKLITSAKDVIEELGLGIRVDPQSMEKIMPANEDEQRFMDLLDTEPLHLDELVRMSGVPIGTVSARLTVMEIKGMVKSLGGGVYRKL